MKKSALTKSSEYARSLIEASLDPLVTISTMGKITDMNEALTLLTGISREKLIGTDFKDYFTDPGQARKVYKEVFAKGFVIDSPLTMHDNKLTDVLFNGSVYKDGRGKVRGAVVVARDITERKRIERELIEARVFAELAASMAELAKTKAEGATRYAESAMKAKQQFLSNMSHEIRTPMNAIIGFTKVVLKTNLSAKQKEYVTAIKMSGDSLVVLIDDILDLAKVDAGKMSFEKAPFRISMSLTAMLTLFHPRIQEKNIEMVREYDNNIPGVLMGDAVRLHQIIINLISNAVKFTNEGKITVGVRLLNEDEENATIEFSVTDTGIGIAKDKLGEVFENFQQATSGTSRLYGGTGLGLAIVKQLVEQQGGTITVKSEVDKGSTFSFILNFLKTNGEAVMEVELMELNNDVKDIKVLVVEDIALNQLLMKTLLDDFGFDRDIAANGKIAVEKLKANKYDIVLMDLQMPVMNGFQATDYIRNTMQSKIPIIALTADVTTVDLEKCKAVGMNDYIAKPVDERILYSKMMALLKKPVPVVKEASDQNNNEIKASARCIDLGSLRKRTRNDPKLMIEIILLYLEQTPPLVTAMKQSMKDKDWNGLHMAVHKMIPSFSVVGIHTDYENMARKVQEYAIAKQPAEDLEEMVVQLESICLQACQELQDEIKELKTQTYAE